MAWFRMRSTISGSIPISVMRSPRSSGCPDLEFDACPLLEARGSAASAGHWASPFGLGIQRLIGAKEARPHQAPPSPTVRGQDEPSLGLGLLTRDEPNVTVSIDLPLLHSHHFGLVTRGCEEERHPPGRRDARLSLDRSKTFLISGGFRTRFPRSLSEKRFGSLKNGLGGTARSARPRPQCQMSCVYSRHRFAMYPRSRRRFARPSAGFRGVRSSIGCAHPTPAGVRLRRRVSILSWFSRHESRSAGWRERGPQVPRMSEQHAGSQLPGGIPSLGTFDLAKGFGCPLARVRQGDGR